MYSTWLAISLIRLPKVPAPEAGCESRTRMRKPSASSSMYLSRTIAAASNFSRVCWPPRIRVAMPSNRSTSRSTTTAYRPSLPPKCSYTTGLETPACAAISSIEVPSNPRSANSRLPMSSSCCRRSWPVIRFRLGLGGWSVTGTSWSLCRCPVSLVRRLGSLFVTLCHPAQAARRAARALGVQPALVRPAHVVGPAQLLEPLDHPGGLVDLALERAVPGTGRVGVVQVVPGLAERGDGQPGDVDRPVAGLPVGVAPGVADRVGRPGHVVQQRDADQAGPEEPLDGAVHGEDPGGRPEAADHGRSNERERDDGGEPVVYQADLLVGEQVGCELLLRRLVGVEQPHDVRPQQALG